MYFLKYAPERSIKNEANSGACIGKMALNHGGAYQVSAVKGQKLKEKIMNKKELCKHIER